MLSSGMNLDLFDNLDDEVYTEIIAPGAVFLHHFASATAPELIDNINTIIQQAPFRHMTTPGGFTMSVAMSSCGDLGWVSDDKGYRYQSHDPLTHNKWPKLPDVFFKLAQLAACEAGYPDFQPNACLINRYIPGTKLSLHQDKDEHNLDAPVVSVSLGIPAVFLFGGLKRNDKTNKYMLRHGDVLVWGGPSRLCYHSIQPLKRAIHPLLDSVRINLTFRSVKNKLFFNQS